MVRAGGAGPQSASFHFRRHMVAAAIALTGCFAVLLSLPQARRWPVASPMGTLLHTRCSSQRAADRSNHPSLGRRRFDHSSSKWRPANGLSLRCETKAFATRDVLVLSLEDVLMPRGGEGGLFKGIQYGLSGCGMPYYIVTTSDKSKASRQLRSEVAELNEFTEDSKRLYAERSRLESLEKILARTNPDDRVHFVDGDLETLNKAAELYIKDEGKQGPELRLYLADWTLSSNDRKALWRRQEHNAVGDANPDSFQVIGLTEFVELLKMGIIMAYGIDSHRQYALDALYYQDNQ